MEPIQSGGLGQRGKGRGIIAVSEVDDYASPVKGLSFAFILSR